MRPASSGRNAAPACCRFAWKAKARSVNIASHDSARLAASLTVPLLIVHGAKDIQVARSDAEALAAAQPAATLAVVPGVNHVLKAVEGDDPVAEALTMARY